MAKDPAFLFYPGDWLGGTLTFTRSHKGAYMDLLMAQYSNGHMSIDDIKTVLAIDFESMWESKLKRKFKTDDNGLYYNQKLEDVINSRKGFTQSRINNLKGKKSKDTDMDPHMNNHMVDHMENGNGNINKEIKEDKEGVIGEEKEPEVKVITWRDDFQIYLAGLMEVYGQLIIDPVFIHERERYHPNLDISLSIEKAVNDFWGTEAGWKHKKKSRNTKAIDWKETLKKALDMPSNQVRKQYSQQRNGSSVKIPDSYKQQVLNEINEL